jgi:hypothetical protein
LFGVKCFYVRWVHVFANKQHARPPLAFADLVGW